MASLCSPVWSVRRGLVPTPLRYGLCRDGRWLPRPDSLAPVDPVPRVFAYPCACVG
jgi:hypothetical protein